MNKSAVTKWVLVCFLGLSLLANAVLVRIVRNQYSQRLRVQLDPAGLRTFPTASALNAPKTHTKDILFLGDSRIALWKSLPEIEGAAVLNRGIAGQTTAEILLRLNKDCIACHPALVVLEAGINDLKAIGLFPERAKEITDTCIENLIQITRQLSDQKIPVILVTVFPPGRMGIIRKCLWSKETDKAIRDVNEALITIGNETVVVVDSVSLLCEGNRVRSIYSADDFHINTLGYNQLNQALKPHLLSFLKE